MVGYFLWTDSLVCTTCGPLLAIGIVTLVVSGLTGIELLRGNRQLKFLKDIVPSPDHEYPSISLIVAARNEERNLEAALRSLLQQDYTPLEIVVVNDRSTDSTVAILDRMTREFPHLKVIHLNKLPDNWIGKNHALYYGAQRASGEWLLFADADIVMEKTALRRAMTYTLQGGWDHVAVAPSLQVPGILLNMLMGAFGVFFSAYARPWKARDPKSKKHIGIGAFNLIRKTVYQTIGTHQAIALSPVDDLKLGWLVKKHGFRQDVLLGRDLLSVEYYHSFSAMKQGLIKNAYAAMEFSLPALTAGSLAVMLLFVWPFLALFLTSGSAFAAYALTWLITVLIGWNTARHMGLQCWTAFTLPFSAAVIVYVMWWCTLKTLRDDGIVWRGTFYPLEKLKAGR